MKTLILAASALASTMAFAHGSYPQQALSAVQAATKMLETSQPREVLRKFVSVTAVKTGHEQFDVNFVLNDNTQFSYSCSEDETVDPVVWNCSAN